MNEVLHTKWGNARINKHGYYHITSRNEGNCMKLLHRLIYEDFWSVKLPPQIEVHHKNGDKLCNCILNLEAIAKSEHIALHNKGRSHSEQSRNKISNAKKGTIISDETRRKMSKTKTSTGFFRVHKQKKNNCNQGFTWRYMYVDENGKRKAISNVNLNKLKENVLAKGLEWIEF